MTNPLLSILIVVVNLSCLVWGFVRHFRPLREKMRQLNGYKKMRQYIFAVSLGFVGMVIAATAFHVSSLFGVQAVHPILSILHVGCVVLVFWRVDRIFRYDPNEVEEP